MRTRVVEGDLVDPRALAEGGAVPSNFVAVLEHLVRRGAYKPFLGRTAGHFGALVRGRDFVRVSSVRKRDHNRVFAEGMAPVYDDDGPMIVAGGARPSVGEHTQREIYQRLDGKVHAIVHVHCPLRDGVSAPRADQLPYECGSVQCGHNTASNMEELRPGIWAVHLDGHGPNVAFHEDVDPADVIELLEATWDLDAKSGGTPGGAGSATV